MKLIQNIGKDGTFTLYGKKAYVAAIFEHDGATYLADSQGNLFEEVGDMRSAELQHALREAAYVHVPEYVRANPKNKKKGAKR
jgi:hypothetical protein